jgi:hypothetical protein
MGGGAGISGIVWFGETLLGGGSWSTAVGSGGGGGTEADMGIAGRGAIPEVVLPIWGAKGATGEDGVCGRAGIAGIFGWAISALSGSALSQG